MIRSVTDVTGVQLIGVTRARTRISRRRVTSVTADYAGARGNDMSCPMVLVGCWPHPSGPPQQPRPPVQAITSLTTPILAEPDAGGSVAAVAADGLSP